MTSGVTLVAVSPRSLLPGAGSSASGVDDSGSVTGCVSDAEGEGCGVCSAELVGGESSAGAGDVDAGPSDGITSVSFDAES